MDADSREKLRAAYARQDKWFRAERSRLLRRSGILSKRCVLDPGAGSGQTLDELRRRCRGEVIACDIDPDPVLLDQADCIVADAHQLPFEDASFDLVFTQMFFLWVDRPAVVAAEILRVLEPGGHLIVCAEPDYGGLIEHPPNCTAVSRYVQSLAAEGADIEIGRKMGQILLDTGFQIECGTHAARPLECAATEPLYTDSDRAQFLFVPYCWFLATSRR